LEGRLDVEHSIFDEDVFVSVGGLLELAVTVEFVLAGKLSPICSPLLLLTQSRQLQLPSARFCRPKCQSLRNPRPARGSIRD
jgi:hypothetical protein